MSKPFLIIQLRPEDETADNELHAIQHYGGLKENEVSRIRAEKNGLPKITLDDYSAIIVGGSPFDISTHQDKKSDIQNQVEADFYRLFDDIFKRDFPFLGCCSGNGLLGSYCGATISKQYGEPVGGTDIAFTEEGKKDHLLKDFPETIRVLTGHKEACDVTPNGSVLLASNEQCPVQMFRIQENIYATQFHPEADATGFEVRINIYKDFGYFPPETAELLIQAVHNESTPHAQLILQRFVESYRA